ncbi:MAG: class I SAM-dependent methyltransferase [Planctomycetota bacterium]
MNRPSVDWLDLREKLDRRFRSGKLADRFISATSSKDLIIDLACGAGANMRYLESRNRTRASWLGIDQVESMPDRLKDGATGGSVSFRHLDLMQDLEVLQRGANVAVTASAFLDMTSKPWVSRLVRHFSESPLLVAMTMAGGYRWSPTESSDAEIETQIRNHQVSDHGFGPAMGADSAAQLTQELKDAGYEVFVEQTDWKLRGDDWETMEFLIRGVVRRVRSMTTEIDVEAWQERRLQQLRRGRLRMEAPHFDVLGLPQ